MKICHVTNGACTVIECPISLYECVKRPFGTTTATTNHTGIITEKKELEPYRLERPVEGGYIGTERGAGPEPVGESQEELWKEVAMLVDTYANPHLELKTRFTITRKEK